MDRDDIDGLFETLARPVDAPKGLNERVISAVYRAEELRRRRIVILHSLAFAVLSAFAVWFTAGAIEEMLRTGFVHIASMIWTDSGVAIANLRDWVMAVVETLPLSQTVWAAGLIYSAAAVGSRLLREAHMQFSIRRWRSGLPTAGLTAGVM